MLLATTSQTTSRRFAVGSAAVAAAGLFLWPVAAPPPSTPLEQVQALVQPSVVYEQITWTGYVYDRHNDGYFTEDPFTVSYQCTGFVVNPDGYIGTAGHCVDYDLTVKNDLLSQVVDWAYTNGYYEAEPSTETIATFARHWRIDGATRNGRPDVDVSVAYGVSVSGEPSGKALPARVVGVRPMDQGDVALLKIEAKDLTVLPLSDNAETGVGTQIVSVGYPASVDLVTDANFNPSFKEGSISAEKTIEGGLLPVYEISAPVSGGMSGGPTTDLQGRVIGVNSFNISGETQPFNFVQPAANLQELMRAEGVENTLGPVTDDYRAGLAAYYAGDRDAAIDDFEQVLATVPSHQFAQDYLKKAQSLTASGFPLWILGLAAVALLAVAGIVVAVVLTRRRSSAGVTQPTPVAVSYPSPPEPVPPAPPEPVSPAPPEPVAEPTHEPAPGAPEEERFCPHCGHAHEPDAQFCPHCGHHLTP